MKIFLVLLLLMKSLLSYSAENKSASENIKQCFSDAKKKFDHKKASLSLVALNDVSRDLQKKNQDELFLNQESCRKKFKNDIQKIERIEELMEADVVARDHFDVAETSFIFFRMAEIEKKKLNSKSKMASMLSVCNQPSYFSLLEELMAGQEKSKNYNIGIQLINLCVPMDPAVLSKMVLNEMKGLSQKNICRYVKNKVTNKKFYKSKCP